jgi:predicted aldo/keto reductase-like oxidoreductase
MKLSLALIAGRKRIGVRKMNYRNYKNKKQISQLGFGAMRLPRFSDDQTDIDVKLTEEIILYAYEHGVNYYDTAYVYHNGKSEVVLGEILNRNNIRDKVNIADKLPTMVLDPFDPYAMFEEQLQRLGTDTIDFYLIHALSKDKWDKVKELGIIEFMETIKKSGRIGALGFSFHDNYEAYQYILDDYDWDFSQIQLNFMDIEYQAGIKGLEYAASKGIPVVIMEPLKGGKLLMSKDLQISELKKKYGLENHSTAEICLNFVWNRPEVLCVLSGMNAMNQIEENVRTASNITANGQPENQKEFLNDLREYIKSKNIIPCTKCEYCIAGCPQKIPIPNLFELYNDAEMFDTKQSSQAMFERFYGKLNDCVECGQCENACPQHLPIIELLKKTREYLAES